MTLGVAYPGEMASGLGAALRNYTIQKSWEASAWEQHERQRRVHGSVVVLPSQVAPGEPVVTLQMQSLTESHWLGTTRDGVKACPMSSTSERLP